MPLPLPEQIKLDSLLKAHAKDAYFRPTVEHIVSIANQFHIMPSEVDKRLYDIMHPEEVK